MDSDDENQESISWQGTPGTIVLINIFDPSKSTSPKTAHAATCLMTRELIRLASSQSLGVCLFGTDDLNSSCFGINGLIDIFPLKVPTLQDLKSLRDVNTSNYLQAKELKLSDALWNANKMFAHCKKTFSAKSIIILSRLNLPPVPLDQTPTLKRVEELVNANIEVRIINVSEDNNIDSFYDQFLMMANEGKDIVIKTVVCVKEIASLMYQETSRHLAVARLHFEIGNDMSIGVGVYRLLRKVYNKKVHLDRETNEILTSVQKTTKVVIDQENCEISNDVKTDDGINKQVPLLKTELLKYLEYGGERVEFTVTELKNIRNPFGAPKIKLLGFKPASVLCKEKWYLKPGYFLYPNENIIEGSTVAFKALHQACIDTGMVAFCVLCTRVNARPIIVALVPCTNPLGLNVDTGFDVIQIPFVENKRDISLIDDEEEGIAILETHKDKMKDIISSLLFNYKHDIFENPKLQSEYRAIETIALGETEQFLDTTTRNPMVFENIEADKFEESFGPFGTTTLKRNNAVRNGPENKKVKYVNIDADLLQERISNNTVQQYNVNQLKEILRSKNITDLPALTGLKKNELVNLVYKYF